MSGGSGAGSMGFFRLLAPFHPTFRGLPKGAATLGASDENWFPNCCISLMLVLVELDRILPAISISCKGSREWSCYIHSRSTGLYNLCKRPRPRSGNRTQHLGRWEPWLLGMPLTIPALWQAYREWNKFGKKMTLSDLKPFVPFPNSRRRQ